MCAQAAVSYLITWWDDMRIALQVALILWLLLLLAGLVLPQVLTEEQNGAAHMRIERELADHGARLMVGEAEIRDFKNMKIPDRLAAIESTQRTNQYILLSILLGIISLLLKDVRAWIQKPKASSSK